MNLQLIELSWTEAASEMRTLGTMSWRRNVTGKGNKGEM